MSRKRIRSAETGRTVSKEKAAAMDARTLVIETIHDERRTRVTVDTIEDGARARIDVEGEIIELDARHLPKASHDGEQLTMIFRRD